MKLLVVGFAILSLVGNAIGQEDSTQIKSQSISAVDVQRMLIRRSALFIPELTTESLKEINSGDAGELVRYIPGAVLKSYGGLGGLKTVSSRGMSTQDHAIVVDGFERNGTQAGQVNLAQIETEQLLSIDKYDPEFSILYIPISSVVKGNALFFTTLMSDQRADTIHLASSYKYGSFNTQEVNVSTHVAKKKNAFNIGAKYRFSDGDYPYIYQNGLLTEKSIRTNNDYRDYYINTGYSHRFDKGQIQVRYRYMNYDQGVPGAVILYNNSADERLNGAENRLEIDFRKFSKSRLYAMMSRSKLNYFDPNYYADTIGLDANYLNSEIVLGYTQRLVWKKEHALYFGLESKLSKLISDRYFITDPVRSSNIALVSYTYQQKYWHLKLNVSEQIFYDQIADSTGVRYGFTPTLSFQRMESKKGITWTAYYKRSFRMPNFNELYYGGIGNMALEPESGDQLSASMIWRNKEVGNWRLYLQPSVFTNLVTNKIVAIPTQNLFVWSMQNVGRVWMYGTDLSFNMERRLKVDGDAIGVKVVYNWLRSVDITQEHTPTYLHQIAYIPEHSISGDIFFRFKKWHFRLMNTVISHRYALNENIDANLVEGFWITDVSLGKKILIHRNSQITLQLNVNNVFNSSYAYVRSYIMPGRNFQITLRYVYK